jgi:hypothetical protein
MKSLIKHYFYILFFSILAVVILVAIFIPSDYKSDFELRNPGQNIVVNGLEKKDGAIFATVGNDVYASGSEIVLLRKGTELKGEWNKDEKTGRYYIQWKSLIEPSEPKEIK